MDNEKGRPGNEIVEGQTVRLDYGHFVKKSFYECRLVFAGGLPPVLNDCDFINSSFAFEGAAINTVQFLGALANGGGEEARDLILNLLGIKLNG